MKHAVVFSTLFAILFVVGCSEQPAPPTETPEPAKPTTDAVEATPPSPDTPAEVASDYPIDYCIVSGEKLGSMGDPIEVTVEGRLVKLCCAACEGQLKSDSTGYLAKLDAAAKDGAKPEAKHDHAHDHAGHDHHDH
ncbi:MAG: hypothetical protein AAGI37_16300 [Planctomycetota bacterium]